MFRLKNEFILYIFLIFLFNKHNLKFYLAIMKKTYTISLLFIFLLTGSAFSFQLFKTSLKVNVRNELGNLVNGAEVTLYENKEDYEKSENPLAEKTTDEKGNAVFEDLQAKVYFINAEKGDANNFGAGEKTDTLTAKRMNKVTIIISE